jgi:hypothetical protein
MASKPIKQKANLGASDNLRVRRIPSLAEYCFIAQAEPLDQLWLLSTPPLGPD